MQKYSLAHTTGTSAFLGPIRSLLQSDSNVRTMFRLPKQILVHLLKFTSTIAVTSTVNPTAEILLDALTSIHRFKEQTVVVALTGGSFANEQLRKQLLHDVYFMASVGARPVVFHGGSIAEDQLVETASGTDMEQQIAVDLNNALADEFEAIGGRAMTLNFESGAVLHGAADNPQQLGRVTSIDRIVIDNLCYAGQTPMIPAMCEGESNERFLLSTPQIAPQLAAEMSAKAVVIVAEKFNADFESAPRQISSSDLESAHDSVQLTSAEANAISGAIAAGVDSIHLLNSNVAHGLLLQLFSQQPTGIEIRK